MSAIYLCCEQDRLVQVRAYNARTTRKKGGKGLNAIESLEVVDTDYLSMGLEPSIAQRLRQRTLLVRCLLPVGSLGAEQVRILGGERITPVKIEWAHPANALADTPALTAEQARFAALPNPDKLLVVRTDQAGDFSRYRLEFVSSQTEPVPRSTFDPRLWFIEFSFKAECPADFDCRLPLVCQQQSTETPAINYLAKDYASFRRLLLERISQLIPDWRPRSPADLGVTLVEWLAYVGDYLSYQQDAVATEAYLATCRSRISLRRHARLMDYFVSEGCNARAWVQIEVSADIKGTSEHPAIPRGTRLLTRLPDQPAALGDVGPWLDQADVVFETLHSMQTLFEKHAKMGFYTWGESECCLPAGATAATLAGHYSGLEPGQVLLFEEVLNPVTGTEADADPNRRHAVRLTRVRAFEHGSRQHLKDPVVNAGITEIEWDDADALPFALILSGRTDEAHGRVPLEDVSVTRGNVALADHGLTVHDESLGVVPESAVRVAVAAGDDLCATPRSVSQPPRFRPRLSGAPLTQRCGYDPSLPASRSLRQDLSAALPADLSLTSEYEDESEPWTPRRDLLGSHAIAPEFVAEMETDGTARIRFGDDVLGKRPNFGTSFAARYRVGNGTAGNVGVESICHIESTDARIVGVRNPLSAQGGTDPEPAERIRDRVPVAYRTQERAVTEADWGKVAARDPRVQRAAGRLRWTGSWYTAFVAIDPKGSGALDEDLAAATRQRLERYRMAGQDLRVEEGRTVPLELELAVCVAPGHFRGDVRAALLQRFSNRVLPDGTLGVFHPDLFSFGQPVYLSRVYAAAQAVDGVTSVEVRTFRRIGAQDRDGTERGRLDFGLFEIARLDNDPNFPERGVFRVELEGGK